MPTTLSELILYFYIETNPYPLITCHCFTRGEDPKNEGLTPDFPVKSSSVCISRGEVSLVLILLQGLSPV